MCSANGVARRCIALTTTTCHNHVQNTNRHYIGICSCGANRLLTRSAAHVVQPCAIGIAPCQPVSRLNHLPAKSDSFTPNVSAMATNNVLLQSLSPRSIRNNRSGVMPTACDSCHCVKPFRCRVRRILLPVVTGAHLLGFRKITLGFQPGVYQVTYDFAHGTPTIPVCLL